MLRKLQAFTLIELLIVVAIIAILAAIAVPNFLEAQTRSKVSRTMNDMRAMGIAYTSYAVDNNKLPVLVGLQYIDFIMIEGTNIGKQLVGTRLTTPIAYLSRIPMDVFMTNMSRKADWFDTTSRAKTNQYSAVTSILQLNATASQASQFTAWFSEMKSIWGLFPKFLNWSMESCGPDLTWWSEGNLGGRSPGRFIYDPTNGTISQGQIVFSSEGWISPAKK